MDEGNGMPSSPSPYLCHSPNPTPLPHHSHTYFFPPLLPQLSFLLRVPILQCNGGQGESGDAPPHPPFPLTISPTPFTHPFHFSIPLPFVHPPSPFPSPFPFSIPPSRFPFPLPLPRSPFPLHIPLRPIHHPALQIPPFPPHPRLPSPSLLALPIPVALPIPPHPPNPLSPSPFPLTLPIPPVPPHRPSALHIRP
ncbi:unnamed protein product [Closterium sp. Naga37s-1]|nr:unnamed protein product [Closterium sp. Naga37s-1]